MPYVQRNAFGQIDSLHRTEHPGVHEYLPSDDPEVQGFVGPARSPEEFSRLDSDFVRVIEDVIDTLIVKNLLNVTDLPAEAQAKLFARKSFRERLGKNALNLFGNEQRFAAGVVDTGYSAL